MKLWAGRFQKETDTLVNDFNSSISFDARMYREDIAGSIAHAAMLGRQGIIEEHEAEKIIDGLKAILADIEADKAEFAPYVREYCRLFGRDADAMLRDPYTVVTPDSKNPYKQMYVSD